MKKRIAFLLVIMCTLLMAGCGMIASAKDTKTAADKALQSYVAENTISVNHDDVAAQSDTAEQYCDYLVQTTESMFKDEDGIESAEAMVSYDTLMNMFKNLPKSGNYFDNAYWQHNIQKAMFSAV